MRSLKCVLRYFIRRRIKRTALVVGLERDSSRFLPLENPIGRDSRSQITLSPSLPRVGNIAQRCVNHVCYSVYAYLRVISDRRYLKREGKSMYGHTLHHSIWDCGTASNKLSGMMYRCVRCIVTSYRISRLGCRG